MPIKKIKLSFIIVWYTLTCCAVALFLYGFFPIKGQGKKNNVQPPSYFDNIKFNISDLYKAQIDRLVFIVIDALRADFLKEELTPYIVSNTKKEKGCILPMKVETPTVTMPRIKAMTTGSVPQFIDIVLNLATSEIKQDSFLQQAKNSGKILTFYGDNTWLKLYPHIFTRSQGTTSFYVTDFTEVDNNVTKQISVELTRDDWDIMILHYLGLDHIGHVHGPWSQLIKPKLNEMDEVVKYVHQTVSNKSDRTGIIVCGDHGMRDAGGHGGSSSPEVTVGFALLGLPCNTSQFPVMQTDLASTISYLFGLSIPGDSVGRILPELIMDLPISTKLYIYYYNALCLIDKNTKYIKEFENIFQEHKKYLENKTDGFHILKSYEEQLYSVSENLVKSSSAQVLTYLVISCNILFVCLLALCFNTNSGLYLKTLTLIFISWLVDFFFNFNTAIFISIILTFFDIIYSLPHFYNSISISNQSIEELLLNFGNVITTLTFISTSFIEEEHQTWFWLWGTLALMLIRKYITQSNWVRASSWCIIFLGLRIFRMTNRVGDQSASEPDISDWLLQSENWIWLNVVFIIGLVGVLFTCHIEYKNKIVTIFTLLTLNSIYYYRYCGEQALWEARVSWMLILSTSIVTYYVQNKNQSSSVIFWLLISCLLLRPYNVLLLPACYFATCILIKEFLPINSKICAFFWLWTVLFFCQGNCNTLASVDISPGYIGLSDYSPFITPALVISHSYVFLILILILLLSQLSYGQSVIALHTFVINQSFRIMFFCGISFLHRNHLFVWSVFSPKLLIESIHTIMLLIIIMLYKLHSVIFNYNNLFMYKYN